MPEQDAPDPAFPTVAFPNPEEPGAVDLLVALAERVGADVAIAEDPDADRCSVVCGGRQLTGDEVGALLADWLLRRGVRGTYASSLVSGSLLHVLAAAHGVPSAETPTGFKWIIRAGTPEAPLVFGYEEALGYAVAPAVVAGQGRHLRGAGRRAAGRRAEGRRAARCSTGSTSWPASTGCS